jgi:hypothetical protein
MPPEAAAINSKRAANEPATDWIPGLNCGGILPQFGFFPFQVAATFAH